MLGAGDRTDPRDQPEHRLEVRQEGRLLTRAPGRARSRQTDDAAPRPHRRVLARGRPRRPEEAEAHRQEGVRPPPGRGGVQGLAVHRREVRPGVARGAPRRGRGLPRARVARGRRPGRLRRVLRRHRRLPREAPRPRRLVPALERPLRGPHEGAALGERVLGARRGLPRDGAGARGARPRQRDRVRAQGGRGRARERAVLRPAGALRLLGDVLQPLRRPREGVRRERGGVPQEEPDGARPGGPDARRAQRPPARGVHAAARRREDAGRPDRARALRGGPRRRHPPPGRPLRRGEVGAQEGGQGGARPRRRLPLPRGPLLAREGHGRGRPQLHGRAAGRARQARGAAPAQLRAGGARRSGTPRR